MVEEQTVEFDEDSVLGKLIRSLGPFGFVAVDKERVNIDDLVAAQKPGSIVRCRGNPSECISVFVPENAETLGCVGGWISEE